MAPRAGCSRARTLDRLRKKASHEHVLLRQHRSRLAFLRRRSRVRAREHPARGAIQSQPHIFGRNVQNTIRIGTEVRQIRFAQFFAKEIAVWRAREPLFGKACREVFLSKRIPHSNELLCRSQIIGRSLNADIQELCSTR